MNTAARTFALLLVFAAALVLPACEDLPAAPNVPPTASFIFNPVSPITAGETPVTFNAAASRDADGGIASYTWTWGDGTPDVTTQSPTVVHVFPDTAARCLEIRYAVLLTVSDDQGEAATASQQVTVIEAPVPGSTACR